MSNLRTEVKRKLKNLNREQQIRFSWMCAVRALPFLGGAGHFNFWKKNKKQEYLYAIFYVIDIAAANAANAAYAVANAGAAANAAANAAAGANAAAANAAANAAAAANAVVAAAAADAAAAAADYYDIDIRKLLLQDLAAIRGGDELKGDSTVYGKVWGNFQTTLEKEGCSYWGKWYQELFDHDFKFDAKEVKERINIPGGIRAEGAASVARYIEDLKTQGGTLLDEARILILGDKGAGKTCLARRLKNPKAAMTTDNESTPGVDISLWYLQKEKNLKVHIWDFAGHTITHAIHKFFLSERCLYILLYDARRDRGHGRIDESISYWLDHMKNYGGNSKVLILVNERDAHKVELTLNILKEAYPDAIEGIAYFNLKTENQDPKKGLLPFREQIIKYITENPSWNCQKIPQRDYQVKKTLEQLFSEKKKEYIPLEKFETIARECKIEKPKDLLKRLHNLGVSLSYEESEIVGKFKTLVLNPKWISEGVYDIINWVRNENKFSLILSDLTTLFKNKADRYPKDKHPYLFDLMQHYELAYYETQGEEKKLIIPILLPLDQLDKLPSFPIEESLMLRYQVDHLLPPDMISRFIVRHNKEIQKVKNEYGVWRYGVLLEHKKHTNTFAMVKENTRKHQIILSVKGDHKTEYLTALRETLNTIFEQYKAQQPTLQYRILDTKEQEEVYINSSDISKSIKNKVPVYDLNTGKRQNIEKVKIEYNITINNNYGIIQRGDGHIINNFKNYNLDLQGALSSLAADLKNTGTPEGAEEAKELEKITSKLKAVEEHTDIDELKRKGILGTLTRFVENLGDEKSSLHQIVKKIKTGIKIAQEIGTHYNNIAQWARLPQIPNLF